VGSKIRVSLEFRPGAFGESEAAPDDYPDSHEVIDACTIEMRD
jgi:hypothetical protein